MKLVQKWIGKEFWYTTKSPGIVITVSCCRNKVEYSKLKRGAKAWWAKSRVPYYRWCCERPWPHQFWGVKNIWNLIITRSLGPWKLPCYIRFIIYQGKKTKKYIELGPGELPCYKRVLLYPTSLLTRFHCIRALTLVRAIHVWSGLLRVAELDIGRWLYQGRATWRQTVGHCMRWCRRRLLRCYPVCYVRHCKELYENSPTLIHIESLLT